MQSPSQTSLDLIPRSISWRPTAALAGVNAAITLSWIVYRVHLVGLLTQAGFPAGLAPLLLLIESALAIFVEPWAGNTSDRAPQHLGGRFYVILIGVGLTALLFAVLPGILGLLQPNAAVNWWLPGLLIIWAIAISMFRSPALALLGDYSPPKQLPLAASLITIAGAVAGAATPLASSWLLSQGVTLTFIGAAVLLLVTIAWLKSSHPDDVLPPEWVPESPLPFAWLVRISSLGLSLTLAFKLAVELFPKLLKASGMQPPLFMGTLFISLAIGALLAGRLATRWGNLKVMRLGLGLTAACLVLMLLPLYSSAAFLLAFALGFSFGFIFNGTLPFIFGASLRQAGLSVGLFFGGAAAANSLYGGALNSLNLSPLASVSLAILALLATGFCITQVPALEQYSSRS